MSKRQIIDTIKAQIDARQKLIDNRSKSNLDEEAI